MLDRLVSDARAGGKSSGAIRSVVGTIEIDPSDPLLERADAAVRRLFADSLDRRLDNVSPARRARKKETKVRHG